MFMQKIPLHGKTYVIIVEIIKNGRIKEWKKESYRSRKKYLQKC